MRSSNRFLNLETFIDRCFSLGLKQSSRIEIFLITLDQLTSCVLFFQLRVVLNPSFDVQLIGQILLEAVGAERVLAMLVRFFDDILHLFQVCHCLERVRFGQLKAPGDVGCWAKVCLPFDEAGPFDRGWS